jgi:hypothetical protein
VSRAKNPDSPKAFRTVAHGEAASAADTPGSQEVVLIHRKKPGRAGSRGCQAAIAIIKRRKLNQTQELSRQLAGPLGKPVQRFWGPREYLLATAAQRAILGHF